MKSCVVMVRRTALWCLMRILRSQSLTQTRGDLCDLTSINSGYLANEIGSLSFDLMPDISLTVFTLNAYFNIELVHHSFFPVYKCWAVLKMMYFTNRSWNGLHLCKIHNTTAKFTQICWSVYLCPSQRPAPPSQCCADREGAFWHHAEQTLLLSSEWRPLDTK